MNAMDETKPIIDKLTRRSASNCIVARAVKL